MKTIRTTIYSLTILLVLFASPLYAASGQPMKLNKVSGPDSGFDLKKFAFSVPMEADFNDSDPEMTFSSSSNAALKPTAPAEATFEDAEDVYQLNVSPKLLKSLVPIAPREAEFGDLYEAVPTQIRDLAPVTPTYASFEEND